MSALTWIGCVAILFGLISFYATNHLGAFGIANLARAREISGALLERRHHC